MPRMGKIRHFIGFVGKCFVSVKGIYYQAVVHGEKITWLVPHHFTQHIPKDGPTSNDEYVSRVLHSRFQVHNVQTISRAWVTLSTKVR